MLDVIFGLLIVVSVVVGNNYFCFELGEVVDSFEIKVVIVFGDNDGFVGVVCIRDRNGEKLVE